MVKQASPLRVQLNLDGNTVTAPAIGLAPFTLGDTVWCQLTVHRQVIAYGGPRACGFPVGMVILTVTATNPGNQIGGTWVAWGTGQVPVGVDLSQSEFNAVEKTGGAKTHTLTIAEMPSHQHYPPVAVTYNGNAGQYRSLFATNSPFWSMADANNAVSAAGNSAAHNNLPPYITCYMWKRIL